MSTQPTPPPCAALEKLDHGKQCKLILLLGPPGSGKAKIIQQWMQRSKDILPKPLSLTIEPGDNQPNTFLFKLIRKCQEWNPDIRNQTNIQHTEEQISGLSPSIEDTLNEIINGLLPLDGDRFLILLKYDRIENPAIHSMIAYIIDYLPPNLHLVISSQVTPPLQIARLRARRELLEIKP